MDPTMWGWIGGIGGIVGPAVGVLGGALGTYLSIRNARTPEARRFIIRLALLMWGLLLGCVGVPLALSMLGIVPFWAPIAGMAPMWAVLGPMIPWANRRWAQLEGRRS